VLLTLLALLLGLALNRLLLVVMAVLVHAGLLSSSRENAGGRPPFPIRERPDIAGAFER
jgi:hypothetical protein